MSEHNITIEGGTSKRLLTAGKYCDRDIVVTAEGGGTNGDIDALITRTITEIRSDVTAVGYYAFSSCAALVSAHFPNAVTINGYGFQNCTALTDIYFPKVTGINGYGFYGCTALENVDFPSLRSVGNYAFRKCSALKAIDLYQTYNINVYAFYECINLEAIVLRKTDEICTLSNVNALQMTKIADGTGYIYVPAALVDSYKAGTVWATYAAQIRALEDYTVDGTTTGALDESKI